TADSTQENLLDRLDRQIYQISMVANISDESFGNATSGTALAYKLQAMSNLAAGFDRKIEKSLRKRYKIWSTLKTNVSDENAWKELQVTTSRNLPKNRLEEAQTAAQLSGIVSHETQLSLLSIIPDPKAELEKIEKETTDSTALISFDAHRHTTDEKEEQTDLKPEAEYGLQ
ncbi:MAG: phage portal protein, partial [Allobaculum sp.]